MNHFYELFTFRNGNFKSYKNKGYERNDDYSDNYYRKKRQYSTQPETEVKMTTVELLPTPIIVAKLPFESENFIR